MEAVTAQAELRRAYVRGGPGAVVSGLVWLAAGSTAAGSGVPAGFTVLFFGGMLIFPISALLVRAVFRRPPPPRENPGGLTVIETVFPMIGGLLAAWLLMGSRPDLVFSVAAIAVGAHYFGFRTAYGDWTYWVLGGVMCVVGLGAIFARMPSASAVPFVIAAIEVGFGVWLTWMGLADGQSDAAV